MEAYVHGVSTRSVHGVSTRSFDDLVEAMGVDSGFSKSDVSRICAGRDEVVGAVLRVRHLNDGDATPLPVYALPGAVWLNFHRNALKAKCADLSAEQLVTRSVPPSPLSLLGLVRHVTEMERAHAVWALGPEAKLQWVWGEYADGGPEWDIDADASMVDDSMAAWQREKEVADERFASHAAFDSVGEGNGRSLRWNLQKLIGEYARHNGHADLIRERIDGQTGE